MNRPYVVDLMEGLSNHGFKLNAEVDAFNKEYMADETIRCKNIDYTNYEEGIYVGYRYFNSFAPKAVAYPFGFGLSYTSFDFKGMKVEEAEGGWNVKVNVVNTGKVAGKDVVQVYVKAPKGELDKPERELKGFAKTSELAPGESCEVCIFVSRESLASYNEVISAWQIDKGTYTFVAAQDAMDNSVKVKVKLD